MSKAIGYHILGSIIGAVIVGAYATLVLYYQGWWFQ